MATVKHNLILEGLSGSLGNMFVLKRDKAGRTIVSLKPRFDENREFTARQKAQQGRFQEAAAYAKAAARVEPIYAEKAKGTPKTAYNIAIADWFHAPEVGQIDLSGYTGEAGQIIRAQVRDDVWVREVRVMISGGGDEVVVEEGQMSHEQGDWYSYTTTAVCPVGGGKVVVTGLDLPGHEGMREWIVDSG